MWNGLRPGHSTLSDARRILGAADSEQRMTNAQAYDFWDGLLRVTILDEQSCIGCLWISGKALERAGLPQKLGEAVALFGEFVLQESDHRSGLIYEGKNVRLGTQDSAESSPIKWIEFFTPE